MVLAIVVATYAGVAAGRWPGLRTNRATIALAGATALVAVGGLPLERAREAIDLDTLALLFGTMVLNANLRLAGFFGWAGRAALSVARGPRSLLALLVAAAGALSALFLNDTICLMLAPLVVELARGLRRDPVPYLVALMAATNAGSVATVTGNPQNMWIALRSGVGYGEFLVALMPVAVGSLVLTWLVVVRAFPREFEGGGFELADLPPEPVHRPLLVKALVVAVLFVALLAAGVDFALAALVSAAVLLLARRLEPERVLAEVDWQLLVLFSGLFVVTAALREAGQGTALERLTSAPSGSVGGLMLRGAVLSNLISNVPAVLVLGSGGLARAADWLALAAASTLAGNLTLLGSVANLIVAEQARARGVVVGFRTHLRVGVPLTLASLVLAWVWLVR